MTHAKHKCEDVETMTVWDFPHIGSYYLLDRILSNTNNQKSPTTASYPNDQYRPETPTRQQVELIHHDKKMGKVIVFLWKFDSEVGS